MTTEALNEMSIVIAKEITHVCSVVCGRMGTNLNKLIGKSFGSCKSILEIKETIFLYIIML